VAAVVCVRATVIGALYLDPNMGCGTVVFRGRLPNLLMTVHEAANKERVQLVKRKTLESEGSSW
jgi:hypothetical protein